MIPHDPTGTELEAMLARAAEQGAKRALADLGLDGEDNRSLQTPKCATG